MRRCLCLQTTRLRLALDQAAYGLFQARAFAEVFFFGDGAGLMAQLEAEHSIFQFVHAAGNFAMNVRDFCDGGTSPRRHGLRNGNGSRYSRAR